LPTLGVCGWLVAAAALPALGALEWIAGGVAQAQQFGPPISGQQSLIPDESLYLLQQEPLLRVCEGFVGGLERSSPRTSDPLDILWLCSASDMVVSYWAKQARDWQLWRSVFFSVPVRGINPSPGKGDFWSPGQFEGLIGPR